MSLADLTRDVTALGSAFVLTLITLLGLPWDGRWRHQRSTRCSLPALSWQFGSAVISLTLKVLIARERPDFASPYIFETTLSFPSGHSFLGGAVYPALAVLFTRRDSNEQLHRLFLLIAIFIALLIGSSRVILGAHYPTDVIAGLTAGFGWVMLCRGLLGFMDQRNQLQAEAVGVNSE